MEINCNFESEASLYNSYMPFINDGGIFIRSEKKYDYQQKVSLTIKLMNTEDIFKVEGRVVWITPPGAQGDKPSGIGLQFLGDNSKNLCNQIEKNLAGMLNSTQITDTL